MTDVSRAIARGDRGEAYRLLRRQMGPGEAWSVLAHIESTEPEARSRPLDPKERDELRAKIDAAVRERNLAPTEEIAERSPELLTPMQVEALRGAANGETMKDTAARTRKSVQTVKEQRGQAKRRLGAKTITHAVALAIQLGYVE